MVIPAKIALAKRIAVFCFVFVINFIYLFTYLFVSLFVFFNFI